MHFRNKLQAKQERLRARSETSLRTVYGRNVYAMNFERMKKTGFDFPELVTAFCHFFF